MDLGKKRRREDNDRKRRKDDGGVKAVPADDEVNEFFAILKRMQVAVKYFQERDGVRRDLTAKSWSPLFEREDFEEVKKKRDRCSCVNRNPGLDLNSLADCDVSGPSG
ncbi:hypothetical protein OROGR_002006 [Orobanche gracilis]